MGSVVNMLVTDLSTNRSPLEGGRPNTEATLVSPGVTIEGNPSDVGLNVTPSIQESKDTPSVRVRADTMPLVSKGAIFPADGGVWALPPVSVSQGMSPYAQTATQVSNATVPQIPNVTTANVPNVPNVSNATYPKCQTSQTASQTKSKSSKDSEMPGTHILNKYSFYLPTGAPLSLPYESSDNTNLLAPNKQHIASPTLGEKAILEISENGNKI